MLSKVTNKLVHPLYVFARKPAAATAFLPLYQSSVFKSTLPVTQPTVSTTYSRKVSLPFATSSCSPFSSAAYASQHTGNQSLPSALPLHFAGLWPRKRTSPHRHSSRRRLPDAGVLNRQNHSLELQRCFFCNADLQAQSKLPEPKYPTFVDDEMVYLNVAAKETLFCESDGQWNAETVQHPKLSIESRLNEKEWFDRQNIFWAKI